MVGPVARQKGKPLRKRPSAALGFGASLSWNQKCVSVSFFDWKMLLLRRTRLKNEIVEHVHLPGVDRLRVGHTAAGGRILGRPLAGSERPEIRAGQAVEVFVQARDRPGQDKPSRPSDLSLDACPDHSRRRIGLRGSRTPAQAAWAAARRPAAGLVRPGP